MAKEYLVVVFPRERPVLINGRFMGTTNRKLELESGRYDVTLGPPGDYRPESRTIDLRRTSSLAPMFVAFEEALQ